MTTSPSGRGRTPNRRGEGSRLRDEIIDAATSLLEQTGSDDAVTLRAVARQVGIAAPSIYAHFPDATSIVSTVVHRTFERFTLALTEAGDGVTDPVERLYALGYGYLRFAGEHPELYRVLFARAPGASHPHHETRTPPESHETVGAGAFGVLVHAIQACVDAGRSVSTDPVLDAIALWSALHGYSGLRNAVPQFPWPDATATLHAMVDSQARLVR